MIGSQVPSRSHLPASLTSAGRDVSELAGAYGLVLDPWQARVLDGGLGERADLCWAARQVGLSASRQSGKTAITEARELAGLLLFGEELIIHSAHLVSTALEAFQRIKGYFDNYDDLRKRVARIREANGEQAVELRTGQRLMFRARARGGGRGMSPDVLVLDEAQILPERIWRAVWPSTSARPNPQAWLLGTAPEPEDDCEVFARLRRSALEDAAEGVAWMEWSAEPDDDPALESTWVKANPAYPHRVDRSAIESELASLSPGGFTIERLGIWPSTQTHQVIDAPTWTALTDRGPVDGTAPTALGLDMSHDRVIAIAACWGMEGAGQANHHVEVVALDLARDGLGAVEWVAEHAGRRIPVVVDAASPAASMIPALTERKVKLIQSGAADMGKACGLFYDDVLAGRLTHPEQTQLDDALAGAKKRAIRDAGSWGWDRKNPEINIAPLVAVTLARYGASLNPRKPAGRTVRGRTSSREGVLL